MSLRCFYAADIHGSEVCWRKFLNAGKFYGANLLILGGDIVGKAIVPIEMSAPSVGRASLHGQVVTLEDEEALAAFEKKVRDAGFYPYRADAAELNMLRASDTDRRAVFERVVRGSLDRWLGIAEEKHDEPVAVLVMGGNDDPWFVDDYLNDSPHLTNGDGRVVEIRGHEIISLGVSNITPWRTHRELEEHDLLRRLTELATKLRDPSKAIFNVHVPPYGSALDDAPRLDETLRPITRMGQVEIGPVGSTAVRQVIDDMQPLIGVHGHIHESRAARKLGRSWVINPGSDYATGRLQGALFEIKKGAVRGQQLVVG
jgi:Icc-related predicted phosphoesterase